MTRITFYQKDPKVITGFVCEGHTGYAEEGSDIVCAAVSALVLNTVNSITDLVGAKAKVTADEENAMIRFTLVDESSADAQLLLRSLMFGLSNLEDQEETGRFIDLTVEEV